LIIASHLCGTGVVATAGASFLNAFSTTTFNAAALLSSRKIPQNRQERRSLRANKKY
jgi:hypothetical protein